jgi:beta-lactamase superfamily II metal-dependent hydrolase
LRFTIEALHAHHGDSLLIHWGTAKAPHLMLVDGGPDPTYRETLRTRLVKLAASRPERLLDIDLLMISHIDDDHINGVQDLLSEIARGGLPRVRIRRLWFNSFESLVDANAGFVSAARSRKLATAAKGRIGGAAVSIIASVRQGNQVARLATQLGLEDNQPLGGLVVSPRRSAKTIKVTPQLSLTIIGPNRDRVDRLRDEWAEIAAAADTGPTALAYVDESVANLSSIVVLARSVGKTMLLTGDARGDDILSGLRAARALDPSGRVHLDLLKLPHHGSDRNVDTDFFRAVIADNYVISGNGDENNPELATLAMLTEARGRATYTIYFTNREPRIERWFARNRRSVDNYKVKYRRANSPSISVDLADP